MCTYTGFYHTINVQYKIYVRTLNILANNCEQMFQIPAQNEYGNWMPNTTTLKY